METKRENLEIRMFGFVPYNISDKQKGIQFDHAVQEFNNRCIDEKTSITSETFENWNKWRRIDKTVIILNGGTTNNNELSLGSLNIMKKELENNDIDFTSFYEPDLGDQLTAVVFLVDERVFDKKKYSDLNIWLLDNHQGEFDAVFNKSKIELNLSDKILNEWTEFVGGKKNIFLRELLEGKKLA